MMVHREIHLGISVRLLFQSFPFVFPYTEFGWEPLKHGIWDHSLCSNNIF